MKKRKIVLAFIIGLIVSGTVVYAASVAASSISYSNATSKLKDKNGNNVTDVQTAVDVLSEKAEGSKAAKKLAMNYVCPGCKFLYTTTEYQYGESGSVLASTDVEDNWETLVNQGKKVFLGVILENGNSGKIQRAFACGVESGVPFCIEGTTDGSKYEANNEILKTVYSYEPSSSSNYCTNDQNNNVFWCQHSLYLGNQGNGFAWITNGCMNDKCTYDNCEVSGNKSTISCGQGMGDAVAP